MDQLFNKAASFLFGSLAARGWNYEKINWVCDYDTGIARALEQKKPAMVVVHRSNCPTCLVLKPRFKNSREIEKLSKEFVMINVEDLNESEIRDLNADGGYVPRILFYDSEGKHLKNIRNTTSEFGKYYHIESHTIVRSMQQALQTNAHSSTTLLKPSRPFDVTEEPRKKVPHVPRPTAAQSAKITSAELHKLTKRTNF